MTATTLAAPSITDGIPRGGIVELFGPLRNEWLVQFLKLHQDLRVYWTECAKQISASTLYQKGLDLTKITFSNVGDNVAPPLSRAVRSQKYGILIASNKEANSQSLKEVQQSMKGTPCILFLLGDKTCEEALPLATQLNIREGYNSSFSIEILKQNEPRYMNTLQ